MPMTISEMTPVPRQRRNDRRASPRQMASSTSDSALCVAPQQVPRGAADHTGHQKRGEATEVPGVLHGLFDLAPEE